MANLIVLGMQWGDEGKGKIVDLLCPAFGAVARYQGGNNAGHTVKFGDSHFALHLIPSGILHDGVRCVLGNGMVIDPAAFFSELERLQEMGVSTEGDLFISERAQVLLPIHVDLDKNREGSAGGKKIGTTNRGIGPAYETKASRHGVRMVDLKDADLEGRLRDQVARLCGQVDGTDGEEAVARLLSECRQWAERLEPFIHDTGRLLNEWIDDGVGVLFEGAQGALLDVDHGTYPFVSSSSSTAGGASTGTGVGPTRMDGVLGVLKAYTTRVGSGPFTTELHDESGEFIRERGTEFGTTTGRPRRCGWLDLVAARYGARVNGVSAIALTKLDILDPLDEIPVCIGYKTPQGVLRHFPADLETLEHAEPMYETLEGWGTSTEGILDYDELPQAVKAYVTFIEERVGVPVALVSTGPKREQTILRHDSPLDRLTDGRLEAILAGQQNV